MKLLHINQLPDAKAHETVTVKRIISVGESQTKLQTFSRAVLHPGQSAKAHTHTDCEELFYFLEGKGDMSMGTKTVSVSKDDVIVVGPGEEHEIKNGSATDLVYLSIRILL